MSEENTIIKLQFSRYVFSDFSTSINKSINALYIKLISEFCMGVINDGTIT